MNKIHETQEFDEDNQPLPQSQLRELAPEEVQAVAGGPIIINQG